MMTNAECCLHLYTYSDLSHKENISFVTIKPEPKD